MDKDNRLTVAILKQLEKVNASMTSKLEQAFRVSKRQFYFTMIPYRGWEKDTLDILTLFALSTLWMARYKLMVAHAGVHQNRATGLLNILREANRVLTQPITGSVHVNSYQVKNHLMNNTPDDYLLNYF